MKKQLRQIALILAIPAGLCGCIPLTANSPIIRDQLKMISAGYTGCMPADNELSNVSPHPAGSGTWNATCKGKVYLCSAYVSYNQQGSYHCAPVAEKLNQTDCARGSYLAPSRGYRSG